MIDPQGRVGRLGGEWVSRYIKRVYPEKSIDVVVKVAPGGETYKIYLVDARDESMRVRTCIA